MALAKVQFDRFIEILSQRLVEEIQYLQKFVSNADEESKTDLTTVLPRLNELCFQSCFRDKQLRAFLEGCKLLPAAEQTLLLKSLLVWIRPTEDPVQKFSAMLAEAIVEFGDALSLLIEVYWLGIGSQLVCILDLPNDDDALQSLLYTSKYAVLVGFAHIAKASKLLKNLSSSATGSEKVSKFFIDLGLTLSSSLLGVHWSRQIVALKSNTLTKKVLDCFNSTAEKISRQEQMNNLGLKEVFVLSVLLQNPRGEANEAGSQGWKKLASQIILTNAVDNVLNTPKRKTMFLTVLSSAQKLCLGRMLSGYTQQQVRDLPPSVAAGLTGVQKTCETGWKTPKGLAKLIDQSMFTMLLLIREEFKQLKKVLATKLLKRLHDSKKQFVALISLLHLVSASRVVIPQDLLELLFKEVFLKNKTLWSKMEVLNVVQERRAPPSKECEVKGNMTAVLDAELSPCSVTAALPQWGAAGDGYYKFLSLALRTMLERILAQDPNFFVSALWDQFLEVDKVVKDLQQKPGQHTKLMYTSKLVLFCQAFLNHSIRSMEVEEEDQQTCMSSQNTSKLIWDLLKIVTEVVKSTGTVEDQEPVQFLGYNGTTSGVNLVLDTTELVKRLPLANPEGASCVEEHQYMEQLLSRLFMESFGSLSEYSICCDKFRDPMKVLQPSTMFKHRSTHSAMESLTERVVLACLMSAAFAYRSSLPKHLAVVDEIIKLIGGDHRAGASAGIIALQIIFSEHADAALKNTILSKLCMASFDVLSGEQSLETEFSSKWKKSERNVLLLSLLLENWSRTIQPSKNATGLLSAVRSYLLH